MKRVKREIESKTAADKAAWKRVAEGGSLFLQSARSLLRTHTHTHTHECCHTHATRSTVQPQHKRKTGRRRKNTVMRLVSRIMVKKYLFHHLAPFFLHKLSCCLSPNPCSICLKQASIIDEVVCSERERVSVWVCEWEAREGWRRRRELMQAKAMLQHFSLSFSLCS